MSKRMKAEAAHDEAAGRQPLLTAHEGAVLRSYISQLDEKTAPTVTILDDGKELSIYHPNRKIGWLLLIRALGTTSAEFAVDIVLQLMAAAREGLQFNRCKI